MEFSEYTRIVFNRIQKIEPENVRKIIGCLLLHDHGDQEMARLAMAPDQLIHEVIYRAKTELQQLAIKSSSSSPSLTSPSSNPGFTPFARRPFSSSDNFHVPTSWDQQIISKRNSIHSMFELQNQAQFLSLEDHIESGGGGGGGGGRHFPSLPEFQTKTCHYYNKGYCKHGNNCRYIHGNLIPDSFSQIYNNNNATTNDDQIFSTGSLEALELEIVELLKSRRGAPISIASLPMIYYEKYGKVLQAEGYLTESQRHGKAGYSLTKLLARLKCSIRLIDRPHGQHAVILAEDAPKYMDFRIERNDPGPIVNDSRQIYMTFPAESTFTDEDVSDYFNTFGLVGDVRIPNQQKRMFGFVTFVSADTVKTVLAKGNPHFICGARVLVKPYREKLKDRKFQDRTEQQFHYSSHFPDMDSEFHSIPRAYEGASRTLRIEEPQEQYQQQALELERRLQELNLLQTLQTNLPYFNHSMNELRVPEDHFSIPSTERFNHLMDVLNHGSTSDHNLNITDSNHTDLDSQGLNLPDSPFTYPIGTR